jgi:hypothetical protein
MSENQTFNDKEMCPYGKLYQNGMTRAFLCTLEKQIYPCGHCRYCRTEERYKMLYSSLQCPLKNK